MKATITGGTAVMRAHESSSRTDVGRLRGAQLTKQFPSTTGKSTTIPIVREDLTPRGHGRAMGFFTTGVWGLWRCLKREDLAASLYSFEST